MILEEDIVFSIKQESYGAPAITSVCYRKIQSVKNGFNEKGGNKLRMATNAIIQYTNLGAGIKSLIFGCVRLGACAF